MAKSSEIYGGVGLGVGLGVLVGLSTSPTAAVVVSALAALVGTYVGLAKSDGSERPIRVGTFGIFLFLGLIVGIVIRANNYLTPTLSKRTEAWESIGFTKKEAADLVAFSELGVVPRGRSIAARPNRSSTDTGVYSSPAASSICSDLTTVGVAGKRDILIRQAQEMFGNKFIDPINKMDTESVEAIVGVFCE